MDHLDRLSQTLFEHLEDRGASHGPDCLPTARLEAYVSDRLTPEEHARVEGHLDGCLSCLNSMVELRDLLHAMADPVAVNPVLEARLRGVVRAALPTRAKRLSREVVSAFRPIGNHTFQLQWAPPRPQSEYSPAAFARRITEYFRELDDRLAGASNGMSDRVRFRRLAREAGLKASEKGISACRRWGWWGWWLVDSFLCALWLITMVDIPLTPKTSLALILLAAGLPWLAVATIAAGIGVLALAAYLPRFMWKGRIQGAL
ncbi:MAG: anti-sigma factor family protein [Nitrospinota bacterium]